MSHLRHLIFYHELFAMPGQTPVLAVSVTHEPFTALGRETVMAIGSKGGGAYGNVEVGQRYLDLYCKRVSQQKARALCPGLFRHIKETTPS